MREEIKKLQVLKDSIIEYHNKVFTFLTETINDVSNNKFSAEDLCDMGFLCRKIEEYCDEIRKSVKSRKDLNIKIMGFHLATQSVEDPGNVTDRIDGELAHCRVEAKVIPVIPKLGEDGFKECMENFGVPENLFGSKLVKVNFDAMAQYTTDMIKSGNALPPGISKSWTEFRGTFRRINKGEK
jgi:hypothetical protein